MILNKLYDRRGVSDLKVQKLMGRIRTFAHECDLEFNELKWFEYAHSLIYSGHKIGGSVLDVGSARSVLPYFLSMEGYDVTTVDVADIEYRQGVGEKFGVRAIAADITKPLVELQGQFDLITCLSVVEHIEKDTIAALNLADCLKPGGIMIISTDFYTRYMEYPDANRRIVTDRPAGSHTDSRAYTVPTFLSRIIEPLEAHKMVRIGETDFNNVDINNPKERCVRGLYTFGLTTMRKEDESS